MLCENIKPDFQNIDSRGGLIQLVSHGYNQVNYIFSKGGCVRGGHYHRVNTEAFYVISGSFHLVLEHESEKEEYVFRAGDMFRVLPGVKHTFYYAEDTELISLYDHGVEFDNGKKDIYR